jgi:hypothetical protein
MKRFSEQFHTKSKSVTLSSTEKQELRERLISYMEYHPLPAELKASTKSAASSAPVQHEAFKIVSVPFSFLFKASAFAAVFALVVVPFMAEQSVPGDTLYAVKVQFNEEVRSTLTFDSYEKVEWETQRVNRRIAEARLLESQGLLTDEMEAEVAQAVRTHTQNAQKEIEEMRALDAGDATIASIEFDSNLEAQAVSLKDDAEEESQSSEVATATAKKSDNLIANAVDESRALNEQPNASTTPSYAKLIARVEQNTTRMYELSDSLVSLNPNTKTAVVRRIADIDRSVEKAIEQSQAEETDSRDILVDVLKRTQKLIVFMTDLDVADTVDLEELIPVVLTEDEEKAKTASYEAEITKKQTQIKQVLANASTTPNANITIKAEAGLLRIAEAIAQMEQATDFLALQVYAKEAIELSNDVLKMLTQSSKPTTTQPEIPVVSKEQSLSTATSTPGDNTATSTATTSDAQNEESVETTTSTTSTASATTTVSTSSVDAQ